jgi:hypothetical protein
MFGELSSESNLCWDCHRRDDLGGCNVGNESVRFRVTG